MLNTREADEIAKFSSTRCLESGFLIIAIYIDRTLQKQRIGREKIHTF